MTDGMNHTRGTHYTTVKKKTYLAHALKWDRATCAAEGIDMAELEALRKFTLDKGCVFVGAYMRDFTEHSDYDNSWLGDRVYVGDNEPAP